MHAVLLAGPGDVRQWVVVRRYGQWRIRHHPRTPDQEWATLTALARVGAPAPVPLWLDCDGTVFGCPTLVTSKLPGRGLLTPRDQTAWITGLAEALGRIHAAPLNADELAVLSDQREDLSRILDRDTPPADLAEQARGREVWEAMLRLWPRIQPSPSTLVHGDYWPGNTLWHRGRLSGVIDWEQARRGDPAQDVAYCRQDLAVLFGPAAAEAFLRGYETFTGRTIQHSVFWDLYAITSSIGYLEGWVKGYHDLGRTDLSFAEARVRLERHITDVLARAAGCQ